MPGPAVVPLTLAVPHRRASWLRAIKRCLYGNGSASQRVILAWCVVEDVRLLATPFVACPVSTRPVSTVSPCPTCPVSTRPVTGVACPVCGRPVSARLMSTSACRRRWVGSSSGSAAWQTVRGSAGERSAGERPAANRRARSGGDHGSGWAPLAWHRNPPGDGSSGSPVTAGSGGTALVPAPAGGFGPFVGEDMWRRIRR